jgi:head-tail adaptor
VIGRMLTGSVTILRAAPVADRYGSESSRQRDWSTATETAARAHVQPGTGQPGVSGETTGDRDRVTTSIRVWLPAGTDITATDRIRYDGDVYEVDGQPLKWKPPRGRTTHIEVIARSVKG